MTKGDVIKQARALGVRLNELTIKQHLDPVVVLLALRMFEQTLTASMRNYPDVTAIANELWSLIEPEVKKACIGMGMSPGAD